MVQYTSGMHIQENLLTLSEPIIGSTFDIYFFYNHHYTGFYSVDEVEAAYSICFSPDGTKLLSGFNSCVRIFDASRPGRDCDTISTKGEDHYVYINSL